MTDYVTVEEPNYSQIPNVFFDHWMAELSPAEFKVLMCIARKTFGWIGKNGQDNISLSQIVGMAGISKRGVGNCLDKLEALKLITRKRNRSDEHGNEATTYTIVVRTPVKVSENAQARELSAQGARELSTQALGNSVHTQKKDLTKEKKPQPREMEPEHTTPSLKEVVVVPSLCLELGATEDSYSRLLKLYTEEQILHACSVARAQDAEVDNFFGWMRNCISSGWEASVPKEQRSEKRVAENMKVIKDKFAQLDGKTLGFMTFVVSPKYIEFNTGGQSVNKVITVEEPNFEAKVREHIKKLQDQHRGT